MQQRWSYFHVAHWPVSLCRISFKAGLCSFSALKPQQLQEYLSTEIESPVQGRSHCCVCSLLHAFKVGGSCSANVPWRADGGFARGSSHVCATPPTPHTYPNFSRLSPAWYAHIAADHLNTTNRDVRMQNACTDRCSIIVKYTYSAFWENPGFKPLKFVAKMLRCQKN